MKAGKQKLHQFGALYSAKKDNNVRYESISNVLKVKIFNDLLKNITFSFLFIFLHSCAPVFSELQSARTVGKNRFEVTPSGTITSFSEDTNNDHLQNHIGISFGYGVTSILDIRMRYEHLFFSFNNQSTSAAVFGIGSKYSLVKDRVAVSMQFGNSLEYFFEELQVHTSLLLTLPIVKDEIDITFAPKYINILSNEGDKIIAINTGLTYGQNLNRFAIHPEFGLLFNIGEKGFFSHFSLAFTYKFGKM